MNRPPTTRETTGLRGALVAAVIAVLAACSPPGGGSDDASGPREPVTTGFDSSEEVTLTVADGWGTAGTGELFGTVLDGFEDEYPNVTIERETTDYASYSQSINLRATSPDAPDVMMLQTAGYGQGFYQFARSGVLLPLDDYADAYGWDDRFGDPANLDVFRFDREDGNQWGAGPLYGLPEQNAMISVFCNRSQMERAGITDPPETLEEFEQALRQAREAGVTPMAQGNTYIHLLMALWNANVGTADPINDWIYGRDGSFDTPENREAAATIARWQAAGYFQDGVAGANDDTAAGVFLGGDAMFMIAGSWLAGGVAENLGDDGCVFQLPGTEAGEATSIGGGLTTPLAINAKSENPDVAAALIDYITSPEVSDQLFEGGWGMPGAQVSVSAAEQESLTGEVLRLLTPVAAEGGPGTTPFIDWATPSLTEQLPSRLQQLASGRIDAETFTGGVQEDWESFQQERKDG